MVVTNTSLGEGQDFKTENNFDKNVKKLLFKILLYKPNGSC